MLIAPIDQAHYHLRHHLLFVGLTFSDHECQGDQCIVRELSSAIYVIQDAILLQEPNEKEGRYPLVTVREGMIEIRSAKGLVNSRQGSLEGIIFLVAKQGASAKLIP